MEFELIKNIIELSNNKIWEEAKKEWSIHNITYAKGKCLCGKYPIVEQCHIINTLNNNEAIVGNCCIKKFLGDNSKTKMFKALSKGKINKSLIELSFEKHYITEWERDYAIDVWRKRILTPKQEFYFNNIRKKIIEGFYG